MKPGLRLFLVARKSLYEIIREIQLLILTIALPLVFLVITLMTYNADLLPTHRIGVLDESTRGGEIIEDLESIQYADGEPIFQIRLISDLFDTDAMLKNGELAAIMSISENASDEKVRTTIYGDALSTKFYKASTILETRLSEKSRESEGVPKAIQILEQPLAIAGPESEFDLYAPGMITFGLLMIIPQTAMLVAREDRWKTLDRLRLTNLRAWEVLGGVSLAQMVVAAMQVIIVLVAAVAMGFNNQGSMGLAILVGLAVSGSAIGQGLVVACFVQDDSQAANVGSTFSMIQVFLSGSFYQLPPLTMFSLGGHQIDVFDIFPATHGFRALQQVLTYGDGLPEIGFRLGATLLLSGVYFGIGAIAFRRTKMKG
jgi:ABC-type multidrug transport system permease subunit